MKTMTMSKWERMEVSQNLNHGLSSFTVYRGTHFNRKETNRKKANQIAVVSAKEILTRKNKFTDINHRHRPRTRLRIQHTTAVQHDYTL